METRKDMTIADLATVSGKGGLYRVLAPTKSGVILESLDDSKTKMVATTNHRLSLLNEISIYTTTKEGNIPLEDVLKKVQADFADDLGVDPNSDAEELRAFMKSVLPEYDEERVYISDIKKLVKWYAVIRKFAPEVLQDREPEQEQEAGAEEKGKAKKEAAATEKKSDVKQDKKKEEPKSGKKSSPAKTAKKAPKKKEK